MNKYKVYERNLPYFNNGIKPSMKTEDMISDKMPALNIDQYFVFNKVSDFFLEMMIELNLHKVDDNSLAYYAGNYLRNMREHGKDSCFEVFEYNYSNMFLNDSLCLVGGLITKYLKVDQKTLQKEEKKYTEKFKEMCKENFK